MFGFSLAELRCSTPKRRDKRVFLLIFMDPSSPRLASSSLGPSNDFRLKEPALLSEPITSGVKFSSPGHTFFPDSILLWQE